MPSLVRTHPLSRGLTELVLCRRDRRNALSINLLEQLVAALDSLARDAGQRVVILRAEGPDFSAGLDLLEAADDALAERSAAGVERALRTLRETRLISIAAVHGGAYAGGAGLMTACDIAIAAENAQIGFPGARRGLIPALVAQIVRTKVRDGDLRDLFLVGEPISAARALQWGLVQRVVHPEQLLTEARRIADAILAGGPEAICITKRLINELSQRDSADGQALLKMHLETRGSEEAAEGLAAFAEKRKPSWMESESR